MYLHMCIELYVIENSVCQETRYPGNISSIQASANLEESVLVNLYLPPKTTTNHLEKTIIKLEQSLKQVLSAMAGIFF